MNAAYEHKPKMTFIGFSTIICSNAGYVKCPEFWDTEYTQKYARLWQTGKPETPIEKALLENQIGRFAICKEKENCFEYWITGLYNGGEIPDGLRLCTLPESDWAMFSTKGPLPCSLQNLSAYVWNVWYPNEGKSYISRENAMLEVYSAGDMQSPDYECGIWVPLHRPKQNLESDAETVATATLLGIL